MLKILNSLKPFFEDNYTEIHVRAYAKLMRISPPTASKMLDEFQKEGLLRSKKDKGYILYRAADSDAFVRLQQLYWYKQLTKSGFLEAINGPAVLFGSLAKGEATPTSDIDIALIGSAPPLSLGAYEKRLGRKIHLLSFRTFDIIPKNLKNAILNGYILRRYHALE